MNHRQLPTEPALERDRGVILVWVAIMLVALIGMTAFVIDVGALYAERRELQNGADAGALGVAADCVLGDCADEWATAGSLAAANSEDANAVPEEVCGFGPGLSPCPVTPDVLDGASGWVMVRTAGDVEFRFAPIVPGLGDSSTVRADAVAAWGPPGTALITPLIFSECEYQLAGGTIDPAVVPGEVLTVTFHDPSGEPVCGARPSGADLPGGFGWLDVTIPCGTEMVVGDWVSADTGVSTEKTCDLVDWRNTTVPIALFDQVRGTGTNAEYRVAGFVGLHVLGYEFPGGQSYRWSADDACGADAAPGDFWICGSFDYVTVDASDFGDTDFGAYTIVMVG